MAETFKPVLRNGNHLHQVLNKLTFLGRLTLADELVIGEIVFFKFNTKTNVKIYQKTFWVLIFFKKKVKKKNHTWLLIYLSKKQFSAIKCQIEIIMLTI